MAQVLEEWPAVSRVFNRVTRPRLDELDCPAPWNSRCPCSATATSRSCGPSRHVRHPQRATVGRSGGSGRREARLSAVQRLALVDAATCGSPIPAEARNSPRHCWLPAVLSHHGTRLPRPEKGKSSHQMADPEDRVIAVALRAHNRRYSAVTAASPASDLAPHATSASHPLAIAAVS